VCLAAASLSSLAAPTTAQERPEALLRRVADATGRDLAAIRAGLPFFKTVDAGAPRELAQAYAIRVRAPIDHIMDRIREDHLLLDDADRGERGRFGDPAAEGDLAGLSLSRSEIRDLARCRPMDCELKLPAGTIERMRADVRFDGSTGEDEANRFFRRVLLETLSGYMESGDGAGLVYEDKTEPLRVEEGFRILLDRAAYLDDIDPSFRAYLGGYPRGRSSAVDDVFTWTVEDLGVKSLVSLNHISFKRLGAADGGSLIAVKRIYSSHYFQADLKIICLLPTTGDPTGADTYVMVFTRQRFDGDLGGLKRAAAVRRLERNAEATLTALKKGLEDSYRELDDSFGRRGDVARDAGSIPAFLATRCPDLPAVAVHVVGRHRLDPAGIEVVPIQDRVEAQEEGPLCLPAPERPDREGYDVSVADR